MMSYRNYSVEDFLIDESFQQYCSGTNPDAVLFWNDVLLQQPEIKPGFQEAVKWFHLLNGAQGNVEEQTSKLLSRIDEGQTASPAKLRSIYKTWIAAAAVVLFMVFGLWFVIGRSKAEKSSVAITSKIKGEEDVLPGGDKAILTLADGSKVILDTADNGAITKQGSVTVIKLNGQLAYNKEGVSSTEVLYNTITTPRGGQYQLVLADGTKVWLNAASSLRFPTAFVGKERKVELTGEGYFEVEHDALKPFHVKINTPSGDGGDVQVLGTHFNINSYSDEENTRTTLLQGSVKVSRGTQAVLLRPGQQAQIPATSSAIKVVSDVDLDEVIAWKNGYFSFHQANVQTVMRQLARWYDVTIEYKGNVPDRIFEGEMQRDLALSQALKILEKNHIHFKVEGKKIVVMP